jgi:hypothetical protein
MSRDEDYALLVNELNGGSDGTFQVRLFEVFVPVTARCCEETVSPPFNRVPREDGFARIRRRLFPYRPKTSSAGRSGIDEPNAL